MASRADKLLDSIRQGQMDSYLVSSRVTTRYISEFTGSNSVILLHEKGKVLFTDFRYTIQGKEQSKGEFEIIEVGHHDLYDRVNEQLKRFSCQRTGFEDEDVSFRQYEALKTLATTLVPASSYAAELRKIKERSELIAIRRAQRVSDAAFCQLLSLLAPGMTELDVATELDYLLKKNGASMSAFDIIIGSGPNGALCHAMPSKRRLTKGDFVVIDFGSVVDGYCSDMTRTISIGEPNKKLFDLYHIVLDAQLCALDALRPGITGKELDEMARNVIKKAGYGEYFGHGLGHGFGLLVHEAPTANSRSEDVLLPGMTITVEPGIYIEGLGGIRIEDCCTVTETGCEIFSSAPKELLVIE